VSEVALASRAAACFLVMAADAEQEARYWSAHLHEVGAAQCAETWRRCAADLRALATLEPVATASRRRSLRPLSTARTRTPLQPLAEK
jgi:hypothetical protein